MPSFPAITLSRSLGSQGTEIGFKAAQRLGWHFCDRRILRMAAESLGRSTAALARQEERTSGFLDSVFASLGYGSPEAPYTPLLELPVYTKDLFQVERRVMAQVLEHAPSVLVGRGAFVALRDRPATLHVSVQAPLDFRIASLVARGKAADRESARQAIALSDRDRAGFIRKISGLDWRDPTHFQMVLNPAELGFEGCVDLLVAEARRRFDLPAL